MTFGQMSSREYSQVDILVEKKIFWNELLWNILSTDDDDVINNQNCERIKMSLNTIFYQGVSLSTL